MAIARNFPNQGQKLLVLLNEMGHNNINIDKGSTGIKSEGMGTIIEIKIITMDSETHHLQINNQMAVLDLKKHIAVLNGMSIEQQRLIYRGRLLRDDELLSAYNISSGDTLHLVLNQLVTPPSGSLDNSTGIANNSEAPMHEVHGSASNSFMPSLERTPVSEQLALLISSIRDVINETAQLLPELEGDLRRNLDTSDQRFRHIAQSNLLRSGRMFQDLGARFSDLGQTLMQAQLDQTQNSPLRAAVQSRQVHPQVRRAGQNASNQQTLSDPRDGRSSSVVVVVVNGIVVIGNEPSHQNEEGSAEVMQQNTEGSIEQGEQAPNPINRRSRLGALIVRQTGTGFNLLLQSVIRRQQAATPIGPTDSVNEDRGYEADISSGLSTAELARDPASRDEIEDENAGTSASE